MGYRKTQRGNEDKFQFAPTLSTMLALFVLSRLSLLLLFSPQGPFNTHTDINFYFETTLLSRQGYYPFVNMWYEYPPLLAYLSQVIYEFSNWLTPAGMQDDLLRTVFTYLYRLVLLIADCAILILVYKITEKAWDSQRAGWAALVYTFMPIPLFGMFYAHQSIPVVFTLLALYWLMSEKPAASAAALALGIASKLTPVFFLGVAVRFARGDWRRAASYAFTALILASATYLPFVFMGGWPWIKASFIALSRVASYSTPWSILDNNWSTGYYGPLGSRLSLSSITDLPGNPSVIPSWVFLLYFGVLFAVLFIHNFRDTPRNMLLFTTITIGIFHLWSKGWSMQWAISLIPLYLASFPERRGMFLAIALTMFSYHKWPLGTLYPSQMLTAFSILARTAVVAISVWMAYAELQAGASKDVLPNPGRRFTITRTKLLSFLRLSKKEV